MHLMEVTGLAAVQVGAAFMTRASVQVEAVFTVRALWVIRKVIIHNPTKVISRNSPDIRATENS